MPYTKIIYDCDKEFSLEIERKRRISAGRTAGNKAFRTSRIINNDAVLDSRSQS